MCGRFAQTTNATHVAASSFGVSRASKASDISAHGRNSDSVDDFSSKSGELGNGDRDNYNMSPGMDAAVIWMENGELKMDRKVWGLVTKGGNPQHPLPSDSKARMGMHFAGLMFNARSDTLFTKPTFSRLAHQGRSCVVALDGYFEWKASPLAGGKGKKQPYFVSRKQNESLPYLLMAGLWTRVATGLPDEPFLDTFTILTTEACKQIEWLHDRMPVCIWDLELAKKWLQNPSPKVHTEIDSAAKSNNEGFAWHMVTTEMSSVKFRGKEAIEPKKGPNSVSAFFAKKDNASSPATHARKSDQSSSPSKRVFSPSSSLESSTISTPSKKAKQSQPDSQKKKGLITSFFQKKGY